MKEVRKIAKNKEWFLRIVKEAPGKVKDMSEKELDENKINKDYFSLILDYIAQESNIIAPTPLEKHQLFEEFNKGKNQSEIIKEEYELFQERIGMMFTMIVEK